MSKKIVNFFNEKCKGQFLVDGGCRRLPPVHRFGAFFAWASLLLWLGACRKTSTSEDMESGEAATGNVYFECQLAAPAEAPLPYSVYAHIGSYKMKVAELTACSEIAATAFEDWQIPEAALAAAGQLDPDSSDVLYILQDAGQTLIYRSVSRAGDAAPYQLVARYADGNFSFKK